MPDGTRYDVPAKVIAEDRAKYYAENDPDTTYNEEYEYTMQDDYELKDWAANNMNWKDVKNVAKKVEEEIDVDFQEGWVNGDKEVVWH